MDAGEELRGKQGTGAFLFSVHVPLVWECLVHVKFKKAFLYLYL